MEPRTFLLDAITPETKNWTAKVSVLNKTEPRTSSHILATYDNAFISSELAPTFVRCDQFRAFLGTKTLISTAAIVIESRAPRTVTAKGNQHTLHEYAAVDELLRPFIITFWNDSAPDNVYVLLDATKEPYIIAALNFTVTYYHNISLSSTFASVILLNSQNERIQALQKWYSIHKDKIAELQHQGNLFKQAQIPFGSDTEAITSVHTLLAIKQPDRCNLLAQGKLAHLNQKFIYPCCAKCHRLTSAEYNCLFDCHSCHEVRQAIPRFCLLIYDAFDEIEVTVFGDEGEKIMQMSAADFLQKYCNDESLIIDSVNSNLRQLQLKMKIHSRVFNKQDGSTVLSHTMQALECQQLPSSVVAPGEIPTVSPPAAEHVSEISAAAKRPHSR